MITPELIAARERFIRPSAISSIAACPGKPTMEAAMLLERGETPAAAEADMGADLHRRCQEAIDFWRSGQEWHDVLCWAIGTATDDELDGWSIFCLRFSLETVRDLIGKYGATREQVQTEIKLPVEVIGFANPGTADVVISTPDVCVIADFKQGWVDQGDCADHEQTGVYAAAAAEMFSAPKVITYLIQPRAEKEHRVPPPALYDAQALRDVRASTAATIRLARGDNPELHPSYNACVYCSALHRCRAAKEWVLNAAEALEVIGFPSDPQDASEHVAAVKVAEKFAKDAKPEIKKVMTAGMVIPGWKLAAGSKRTSISSPGTALQRLLDHGHNMITLANLGAIKLAPAALPPHAAELVADYVSTKQAAPSLTADKRGAA